VLAPGITVEGGFFCVPFHEQWQANEQSFNQPFVALRKGLDFAGFSQVEGMRLGRGYSMLINAL
jgi:hypothetical protein